MFDELRMAPNDGETFEEGCGIDRVEYMLIWDGR